MANRQFSSSICCHFQQRPWKVPSCRLAQLLDPAWTGASPLAMVVSASSSYQSAAAASWHPGTDGRVTVGNGCVSVVFLPERGGSIVASWDGRNTMSLNLFTTDSSRAFHEVFADKFFTGLGASLAVELKVPMREEVPRGTRVVNFDNGEDTKIYHWQPEEKASEEEEDDDTSEEEEDDDTSEEEE